MAKIMIVDDEEAVVGSIAALLKTEGHETAGFSNVPDALDALDGGGFDLIVTDIRMAPIDGMELIRTVHESNPNFPVIVISAYTSEKIKTEGYRLGCSHYLSKPFSVDDVLDAVNDCLK